MGRKIEPKIWIDKVLRNPRPMPRQQNVQFTLFDLNLETWGYIAERKACTLSQTSIEERVESVIFSSISDKGLN